MSLHNVAQHLAAQGRGPDDHLIHMSGKEIAGLQALANMHGGSLTRNPKTGLPEAGFLDSLLPTVIGAGVMAFAPELGLESLTAGEVGLGVGALNTMATGNLGKGIMAGLGAYGGAGLEQSAAANGMFSPSPQTVNTQVAPALTSAPATVTTPQLTNAAAPDSSQIFSNPNYSAYIQNAPIPAAPQADLIGQIDARSAYDPSFQSPTYNGPTETSLKPYSVTNLIKDNPKYAIAAAAPALMGMMQPKGTTPTAAPGAQMIRPYTFDYNSQVSGDTVGGKPMIGTKYTPGQDTSERTWVQPTYTAQTPYIPVAGRDYAAGGSVEEMANKNAVGANTGYPQAYIHQGAYATPWQTPVSQNVLNGPGDVDVDPYTGEQKFAAGGMPDMGGIYSGEQSQYSPGGISGLMNYAKGGTTDLGGYSDGGRMLKGPGDGMSDSIPASIAGKQPARLADGEFVVPADVVSHLGNGSTDAGAKQLYNMMDKVRQARTGRKAQGKQINPNKYVPV